MNYEKIIEQLTEQITKMSMENDELKLINQNLEEKLTAALDRTGLFVWEQDVPAGKLKILNQTFGSMCGYKPNEIEATVDSWKGNLHPDDKERVINAFEDHLAGKTPYYHVVHRMIHKDGSDTWVSDRGRVIEFDNTGKPLRMMGTHIDITQEKRYELELAQYANLDTLTGLLNRKALENVFDDFTKNQDYNGGALLFIDLDDFKQVNDVYGHKIGDQLLIHIAAVLKKSSPAHAHIARFGGDEFIIICEHSEVSELSALASSLISALIEPVVIEDNEFIISVSIGICSFRRREEQLINVYERADKAMYAVKRKGKNNYTFWTSAIDNF